MKGDLSEVDELAQTEPIVSELSAEALVRQEVIQTLLEPCDRVTYGEKLREGARRLDISVRSLQRLFKRYQAEGLAALISGKRTDKGKHRVGDFWQGFIVNTYKTGNQGSRRMSPKQVALRVQVKAVEIDEDRPPSYKTVLRILKPIQDEKERAKSIRSPGYTVKDERSS
jgi:putative transposase